MPGLEGISFDFMRKCQSAILRLPHYFQADETVPVPEGYFRASAHVHWDLTTLFQRARQPGLGIRPREILTLALISMSYGRRSSPRPERSSATPGNLLMSWSGDRFKTPMDVEKNYFGPS
ncbi:hypothetical protein B2J93_8879 [Marssonina coronariae]|uniref:Uncharacterized protein n=1 Tax=Diplocarpon coronariae TaxID=2795749 RepID=A0A218YSW2_9HELO|nr:hypothetical protein B2J93_8879 [Marssonina coronariae]